MVAFEMAQQLHRQGQAVAGLFLFDPTPPHNVARSQSVRYASFLAWLSARVSAQAAVDFLEPLPLSLDSLRTDRSGQRQGWRRSLTKPLKKIICQMYIKAGWPVPVDLREFYALNARFPLIRRYRPQSYAGKVILFKISERPVPTRVDWEYFLTGETETYQIPGSHHQVFQAPYFQTWAPQMAGALQRVTDEIQSGLHP
jgi:thioesterase domain-containing protein